MTPPNTPDRPATHETVHAFEGCSDDHYRDGARLGCPRCQQVQRIVQQPTTPVSRETHPGVCAYMSMYLGAAS